MLVLVAMPARAAAYQLKVTSAGSNVRWHGSAIELQVMVVEGAISRADVLEAVSSAAGTWSSVPGVPQIRTSDGNGQAWGYDGINGVYVLERWPFADRRLAVTVSTYVEGTGVLLDTDILVNGEMAFEAPGRGARSDRYDLQQVLTHELGHALGLDESDVSDATMWPRTRMGDISRRELAPDDVDGVIALYGGGSGAAMAPGCSVAGIRSTPGPARFIGLLLFGLLCRRFLRRRGARSAGSVTSG